MHHCEHNTCLNSFTHTHFPFLLLSRPPQVFSRLFLLLLLFPQFNLGFRPFFQLAVLGV